MPKTIDRGYTAVLAIAALSLAIPVPATAAPLVGNPHDLVTEHVDLNFVYSSGAGFDLQPRDDDNGGVAYPAHQALLHVDRAAEVARPGGAAYDFTGAAAGERLYALPQGQDFRLLYLGFAGYGVPLNAFDRYDASAESGGRVSSEQQWVKATLASVKGPGAFSVWQSDLTAPKVFMSTARPSATAGNSLWMNAGGHVHYNFGFTRPGLYQVNLRLSGHLNDDNPATLGPYVEAAEPTALYFNVDPGYATSAAVASPSGLPPVSAPVAVDGSGFVQTPSTNGVVRGAISITNVSAAEPAWILLDLADDDEVGALVVALGGFDPDDDGYQPGLNTYGLLDVASTAVVDQPVLSGHAGYDVALRFDALPGNTFDFEFDYSMILDGVGIDRVGVVATAAVPEPASLSLVAAGAVALLRRRRRRRTGGV
jgi:surface-anchored protein